MPITITLTEAQEQEIILQLLQKKTSSAVVPSVKPANAAQKIREAVLLLEKGKLFAPSTLLQEIGVGKDVGFGSAVKPLIESGSVKMIQRGTWKRL